MAQQPQATTRTADVQKIKEEFIELHNQVPELIRYVSVCLCACLLRIYFFVCCWVSVCTHVFVFVWRLYVFFVIKSFFLALKYACIVPCTNNVLWDVDWISSRKAAVLLLVVVAWFEMKRPSTQHNLIVGPWYVSCVSLATSYCTYSRPHKKGETNHLASVMDYKNAFLDITTHIL